MKTTAKRNQKKISNIFVKKTLALQAKTIRVKQLMKAKETRQLNRLIAAKMSGMLHRELGQVKFAEKVFQEPGERGKGKTRKKGKNARIRLKAGKTIHVGEEQLDYLVISEKKLKHGKIHQRTKTGAINTQNASTSATKNSTNTPKSSKSASPKKDIRTSSIDSSICPLPVNFTRQRRVSPEQSKRGQNQRPIKNVKRGDPGRR